MKLKKLVKVLIQPIRLDAWAGDNKLNKKVNAWVDENHDCAGQTNPPLFKSFAQQKKNGKKKKTSRSKKAKTRVERKSI